MEVTSVRISKEDKKYCEDHGLALSFLLREAIKAQRLKDDIIKKFVG